MSIKSNINLKIKPWKRNFLVGRFIRQAGTISYTLLIYEINTKKKNWQISGGSAACIENHGAY